MLQFKPQNFRWNIPLIKLLNQRDLLWSIQDWANPPRWKIVFAHSDKMGNVRRWSIDFQTYRIRETSSIIQSCRAEAKMASARLANDQLWYGGLDDALGLVWSCGGACQLARRLWIQTFASSRFRGSDFCTRSRGDFDLRFRNVLAKCQNLCHLALTLHPKVCWLHAHFFRPHLPNCLRSFCCWPGASFSCFCAFVSFCDFPGLWDWFRRRPNRRLLWLLTLTTSLHWAR